MALGRQGFEIHGRPEGSVMSVEFEIAGQNFTGLNGGPRFKFKLCGSSCVDGPCGAKGKLTV
jgi:predicted 3-demethylubiquinone-9 3-methyltransferase (glyoxalase superfamily)